MEQICICVKSMDMLSERLDANDVESTLEHDVEDMGLIRTIAGMKGQN